MTLTRLQEARNANDSHYKSYEIEGDVYNLLLNNYSKAKRLYNTAINRTNETAPIQLKLSRLHLKHHEYQMAINSLNNLLASDTLADSARFYLGKVYIDNVQSYEKGLSYLSKIELPKNHPHEAEFFRLQGDANFVQQDFMKAKALYSDLIHIYPADGRAYYYRGLSFLALKDTLQSCNDFEKAVSLGQHQAKHQIEKVCTE